MTTASCETCRAVVHLITGAGTIADGREPELSDDADRFVALDEDLAQRVKRMEGYRRGYAQGPEGPETREEEQHRLGIAEGLRMAVDNLRLGTPIPDPAPPAKRAPPREKTSVLDGVAPKTTTLDGTPGLGKCERAILGVLAHRRGKTTTKAELAFITGYSVASSGFDNALSALRSADYITRGDLAIAEPGYTVAIGQGLAAFPVGKDIVAHWRGELPKCESAIFVALVESKKDALTKAELAEATGYSEISSGFDNALSYLRARDFITGERGRPISVHPIFRQGRR